MTRLPPFPVDDETLDLLDLAIGQGCVLGALDLLAGYDPARSLPTGMPAPEWAMVDQVTEYTDGPLYHFTDPITALIAEVRRLRSATTPVTT